MKAEKMKARNIKASVPKFDKPSPIAPRSTTSTDTMNNATTTANNNNNITIPAVTG